MYFIISSACYVLIPFIPGAEHINKVEFREPSPLARLNPKFPDVITLGPAVIYGSKMLSPIKKQKQKS